MGIWPYPDIILCDFNMPNLRGDQFHDKLIKLPKHQNIPFIFLSAIDDENLKIIRKKKGAAAYLTKPIIEKDLKMTVETLLKKRMEDQKTFSYSAIDPVTSLFNQKLIKQRLHSELSFRNYQNLAIIILNIDNLKKITDAHGYNVREQILALTGKILTASLREYDEAGRYGKDNFLLILPQTNLKQAKLVADKLKNKFKENNFNHESKTIVINTSFGITSLKDNADFLSQKLKLTDLGSIFNIADPLTTDWQEIQKLKRQIAELMLEMAEQSLYNE